MPIEIKELVIRAVVGSKPDSGKEGSSQQKLTGSDRKLIQSLEKTVERLKQRNER